jgi:SAM-dependent methyltransferase
MNENISNKETAGHVIQDDPWSNPNQVLHRIAPTYSNDCYLVWVDLKEFIKRNASQDSIKVLDYGAGASPYKQYFPKADYRRADVTKATYLDYHIQSDSTIVESDETFDLIISTQVAEHVINPDVYFKECFRLLKKGGKLILTTHGIWEEHGSPYDFQRWTEEGFRRDLTKAGFKQMDIYKLTCGMRAGIVLFTRILFSTKSPESPVKSFLFKAFRFSYSRIFGLIHWLCEKWFPEDAIVNTRHTRSNPIFYVDIAVVAQK